MTGVLQDPVLVQLAGGPGRIRCEHGSSWAGGWSADTGSEGACILRRRAAAVGSTGEETGSDVGPDKGREGGAWMGRTVGAHR